VAFCAAARGEQVAAVRDARRIGGQFDGTGGHRDLARHLALAQCGDGGKQRRNQKRQGDDCACYRLDPCFHHAASFAVAGH
jgi:hypothetical protein